jgi:hypothetical protein
MDYRACRLEVRPIADPLVQAGHFDGALIAAGRQPGRNLGTASKTSVEGIPCGVPCRAVRRLTRHSQRCSEPVVSGSRTIDARCDEAIPPVSLVASEDTGSQGDDVGLP